MTNNDFSRWDWVAHRGASSDAPENTMKALRLAAEQGASWVECDVQLTSNSEAVIIHDDSIERVSGQEGKVADMTADALCALDVGSHFSDHFAGERVPRLGEYLDEVKRLGVGLHLELKTSPKQAKPLVRVVLQEVARVWTKKPPIVYSSFCEEGLTALRAVSDAPLALSSMAWSEAVLKRALELNACAVHLPLPECTQCVHDALHEAGLKLGGFTVRQVKEVGFLACDYLFSDLPLWQKDFSR